jgi:NitT/TauT family transport system ATP-binding protein
LSAIPRGTRIDRVTPLIAFERVGLTYRAASGAVEAVQDLSFTVQKGEFIAIVGPSGCGKSTLLRMVAGLRPPTRGTLLFEGQPILGAMKSVGMVFQAPVLLPWRTITKNILLAAELSGLPTDRYLNRAAQLLEVTGLKDFGDRLPKELSGGMQQRASLCRALLLDPPLLLMDEPFGALDAMTRDEMNLELLRIWESEGGARKTILFVTHSIPEAIFLADRVVVMTSRPGRVAAVVDIPISRPRTVLQRSSAEFGALTYQLYQALKVMHPGNQSLL